MRSIEEKVKVPEGGKDAFRNEVFRKVAMAQRRSEYGVNTFTTRRMKN
jgi:predicted Ser/Thr protein kinase